MRRVPQNVDLDLCVSYTTGPIEYKRLWSAVMLRALDDLAELIRAHKSFGVPAVMQSEPYHWILTDKQLNPGGFIWICNVMGWCPDETRDMIRRNWRNMMKRGWRSQRAVAEGNTTIPESSDDD